MKCRLKYILTVVPKNVMNHKTSCSVSCWDLISVQLHELKGEKTFDANDLVYVM